jgi:hypothetical protein
MMATDIAAMFFMSMAPRPQMQPSAMSPENGGWRQRAASASTTSRCAVSNSGALAPVTPEARHHVRAAGRALQHHGVEARGAQLVGQQIGGGTLVAGRVRRVDLDEPLTEVHRVVAQLGVRAKGGVLHGASWPGGASRRTIAAAPRPQARFGGAVATQPLCAAQQDVPVRRPPAGAHRRPGIDRHNRCA